MQNAALIEKIQNLPPETLRAVEYFVDYVTEKQKARLRRNEEMAAFAEEFAGTEWDLDEELEAAGAKHLLETVK
jgi:hypothetical protein